MNLKEKLQKIGLSEGETVIYLALLQKGSVPVSKLKDTNLHRTTIYDFLDNLISKGLVTYVINNNVKFYKATHPNKLLDFIKEKEDNIKEIIPSLITLSELNKEELNIQVYKGVEGFKTLLNDVLRHKKDYVVFGIDEKMFQEKFGSFMEQFFMKEKKLRFKERLLTTDDAEFVYPYETAMYRYLPKESFNPTPTYVWGNNVGILIWEPLTVIRIENAALADSYKKHFEILWKIAKHKPKLKSK